MHHVQRKLALPERRVCRAVGQARSTQRYQRRFRSDELALVRRMHELAARFSRFGYRRIWALLRAERWKVSRRRIHRLWQREGLKVPPKQKRRRRRGASENSILCKRAEHKDHVWTWDFIHDRTESGSKLKWLSIVDEFTKESVVWDVERRFGSMDVVLRLARLFRDGRVPEFIRSDNGPEFVAEAIRNWLDFVGVKTLYIAPGSPWENGYVESFHGKARDEFLNTEIFRNVLEAKVLSRRWQEHYNYERPHSALGYMTPAAFAKTLAPANRPENHGPALTASGI